MVMATHNDVAAVGAGSRISPAAQDAMMANYGFYATRMAVPPITDTHDAVYVNQYGGRFPLRYVTRYLRGKTQARSVNEGIASGEVALAPQRMPPPEAMTH